MTIYIFNYLLILLMALYVALFFASQSSFTCTIFILVNMQPTVNSKMELTMLT
jgi:hypothetical protein